MARVGNVDSIVDFAAYLQHSLLHKDQPITDLSVYLEALPLSRKDLSSSDRVKLDKQGMAVWNICGRLRQTGQLQARRELLSKARAFAYLLLESASEASTSSLKNALQVAKECLNAKLLRLALKIVERAAVLQETLPDYESHVTQYLLLRLALAWQQDRLDLAEHFFAKLYAEAARPTAASAQTCIDLFFEIGKDYLEKKDGEVAARWLERAAVIFEEHNLVGPDATDLRLNVLHTYARALLELKDANQGLLRAWAILEALQRLYGTENVAVLLLQLEIASRGDPGPYLARVDASSRLQLTNSHHKAVIHHIYHLRKLDPRRARRSLKQYLLERLSVLGNDQWIEHALITLVWMSTSLECTSEAASLDATFTELRQIWTQPLSVEVTHGTLVLLWKRTERSFDNQEYRDAGIWCQLAMHGLLSDRMEDLHAGKIQRKFLQCLLKQSKPEAAREAVLTMFPSVKQHPLSLYLTYRIATQLTDEDLAQDVLLQAKSDGVLLACVRETLRHELDPAHSGERTSTRICKVFGTAANCIYRSASFSLFELNWFTRASFDLAQRFYKEWRTESTIQLLGHAAVLPPDVSPDALFADEDRSLLEEMRKRKVISLFTLSILHTAEARIAESVEARIRNYKNARENAHFFSCEVDPFIRHDGRPASIAPKTSKEDYSRLLAQQITLLPIEFEAAIHGSTTPASHNAQYDRLSNIITETLELNAPARIYAIFVDMVLCAVSRGDHNTEPLISTDTAAKLLRQLISTARETEGYGALQASRWIRCVLQLVISGSEQGIENENMVLVEEVVGQAIVLAATGASRKRERGGHGDVANMPQAEVGAAYPAEELEWLSTTLFNLAVDYYVGEEEELGKKWARIAVELANRLATSPDVNGDGGLLARVLRGKMIALGWIV